MNLLCAGAEKFFFPGSVIGSLFFFWTIIDQDVADASFKLMHSIPLQVSFGPVDQIFQKKTQFFRGGSILPKYKDLPIKIGMI